MRIRGGLVEQSGHRVVRTTSLGNSIRQKVGHWPTWVYSIALWFVVIFALRNQRGYQDSWILEDILVAVLFLVVAFVLVAAVERNSGRLVLLASSFVVVLRWIPGLKYVWAYGTTVGLALHTGNTNQIMQTGFPPAETPYSNTPGMHVLLSAIALVSNTTAEEVVRFAFPIVMALTLLLIYFLCTQIDLDPGLRNQIIIASAFAFDPHFLEIEGTSFGSLLVTGVLVWFLAREFGPSSAKLPMTVILLGGVTALVFSHAVTSFVLAQLLLIAFITLGILSRSALRKLPRNVAQGAVRLLALTSVLFLSWWMYRARFIFNTVVEEIGAFVLYGKIYKAPLPNRLFQIPFQDALIVLWMMHANTIIVFLLASIGVIILWWSRHTLPSQLRNLAVTLFAVELGLVFILVGQFVSRFGTLEYTRIIGYAVALSPFFAGVALWRMHQWNRQVWGITLLTILLLSLMQVFPYQPMMPGGSQLFENVDPDEPILYLHTVATDYQADMLEFAESHTRRSDFLILSDKATRDLAYRFWGAESFRQRRFKYFEYSTATETTRLDSGDWQVLLLHRAGIAGPLVEPLEFRSRAEINRILSEPGRSLIYSNGESFVLLQP
jgi:hypothetical protein